MYSEADADLDAAAALSTEALGRVVAYFGAAPMSRYTVSFEVLRTLSPAHRYGFSIEHLNSTSICLDAAGAGGLSQAASAADRERALFNLVHHMAHAFIPERCHGPGYRPFPWEVSPVLDTIWLSEGFIQYAAIEILTAALPANQVADGRKEWIERRFAQKLVGQPAFLSRLSLVELSRLGSDRYGVDFRIGRSLFARGGLLAAALDARIGERSAGKRGLRDALRYLVAHTARTGQAFQIAELPALFRAATGVDTADIWARWLGP
jgi:predicted metalloprotease with PDZ domain